jgi:hypothetical protein
MLRNRNQDTSPLGLILTTQGGGEAECQGVLRLMTHMELFSAAEQPFVSKVGRPARLTRLSAPFCCPYSTPRTEAQWAAPDWAASELASSRRRCGAGNRPLGLPSTPLQCGCCAAHQRQLLISVRADGKVMPKSGNASIVFVVCGSLLTNGEPGAEFRRLCSVVEALLRPATQTQSFLSSGRATEELKVHAFLLSWRPYSQTPAPL